MKILKNTVLLNRPKVIFISLAFVLSCIPLMSYSAIKDEAKTIFITKHHTTSKDGLAEKATKSHKKLATKGWEFKSLVLHIEDGDLREMFITYLREEE
jgi:hypothetical protein